MSAQPARRPGEVFAEARMPSSALIDKLLRSVEDDPGAVLDEHTLDRFCSSLSASARLLSECTLTTNPVDRAESFRYLLTMAAYAVDAGILNPDPLEPMFSQPYRLHLLDWGAASPDGVYRRAMVRDDRSYRVHGRLGNADYFSMDFRQSAPACTILRGDLECDAEGEFEVFIGGEPRDERWWPCNPGTTGLVTREFFADWLGAQRSHLRIECLDGETAPRREHHASRVAAEFDVVGDWILEGAVRFWINQSQQLEERSTNRFDAELSRIDSKLPVVTTGFWRLAPDEALIVELTDPDATFWGLQLATSLWHTLDYANRLTTTNSAQAHRDPDGMYRIVVSSTDPGISNWLDTTGLERGVLILRFCEAAHAAPPATRVVKVSTVADELPAAMRCTVDERRAQVAGRREGVAHLILD